MRDLALSFKSWEAASHNHRRTSLLTEKTNRGGTRVEHVERTSIVYQTKRGRRCAITICSSFLFIQLAASCSRLGNRVVNNLDATVFFKNSKGLVFHVGSDLTWPCVLMDAFPFTSRVKCRYFISFTVMVKRTGVQSDKMR